MRERRDGYRGRIWAIPEPDELPPLDDGEYPPFIGRLLRRRGIRSAAEARRYLFDEELPITDARELPGVPEAVTRIQRAIRDGETIAIYGDYDVDGVTATAILTEAIREAGGRVVPYIPDRFAEGYGLQADALAGLRRDFDATLVITADCGITAVDEVEFAREIGQDVVIVDHHIIPPVLPNAAAAVNPKLPGSPVAMRDLATGGIAARMAPVLLEAQGRPVADLERWLDLAALATVADVVPLVGENRWLVREGLVALRRTPRPGLRTLMDLAGLHAEKLDTEDIGFGIAPRLNAAGRLEHARAALELLLETDPQRAQELAQGLNELNLQRRAMTLAALQSAAEQMQGQDPDTPLICVGAPDISSGIVGLVAGRLADEYHRPAVVYEEGPDVCRASCRSVPGFHFAEALQACGDLLDRHGGHAMAAGFTVPRANLAPLKERLTALAADQLQDHDRQPRLTIDGQVPLAALGGQHVRWLMRMAPFGEANPPPMFVSTGVTLSRVQRLGEDEAHLRLQVRAGNRGFPAIGFRLGALPCEEGQTVDLVWSLRRDNFRGGLELEIHDFAPATG